MFARLAVCFYWQLQNRLLYLKFWTSPKVARRPFDMVAVPKNSFKTLARLKSIHVSNIVSFYVCLYHLSFLILYSFFFVVRFRFSSKINAKFPGLCRTEKVKLYFDLNAAASVDMERGQVEEEEEGEETENGVFLFSASLYGTK